MSPRVAAILIPFVPMALSLAAPAQARVGILTVIGRISMGSDGGNELDDVTNGPDGYQEHFVDGTVFGTAGDLTGSTIKFQLTYDTDSPDLPVATDGLFDDPFGQWLYSTKSEVTISGTTHDFLPLALVTSGISLSSKLQLTNGAADGLSGAFNGFTFDGGVLTNYRSGAFSFDATLPAGFFSTDETLPGGLPVPNHGFVGGKALGTGSFLFTRQTCFLSCSYKAATGDFTLVSARFGAVPEPGSWAMMIVGLGITGAAGAAARRRRPLRVID